MGQLIKEKLEESGMTVTEFARRIHISRRQVYQIFKKNSIDTDLLHNIAKVLGSDWIVEYFIRKYQYPVMSHNQSAAQRNRNIHPDRGIEINNILKQCNEQYTDIKRSVNEIKAMQHFILNLLEKNKR